jgi:long-chain acyl-CoA synthetase
MDHARGSWIPESLNPKGYQNLVDLLRDACRQHHDKPAFSGFGRTISFEELDHLSDAFAVYVQKETDLVPGDRIAIQLPNLIQYPVVVFGALKAGLVIVNTNPLYTPREMAHQFIDSGAKALVIHASMAHNVESILETTCIQHLWITQIGDMHGVVKRTLLNCAVKYLKKMEPDFDLPTAKPLTEAFQRYLGEQPEAVTIKTADVAALQYTGGTTGVSKGAMLTHGNLVSNVLQGHDVISRAGDNWQQTTIAPLPLYHIYAFTISMVILEEGGHSVLIANPRDIGGFIKEMKHWKVTTFLGLNTLFVALSNHPEFPTLDFSQLRLTISGGMPLTHAAAEQWQKFTGCEILEGYGLTEASPAVSINPPGQSEIGSIGWPLAETDVQILDKAGEPLPDGQAGDLCVKGPQVMPGYWHREEDTKVSFTDKGYLMTGDVAVRLESGRIRIVDRAKDLIIVSGFNVYPNEIEDVVASHPLVSECAVIGIPSAKCGEVPKLYVVLKEKNSITAEDLLLWCKSHLTSYKVPKQVAFVDDLPKSNVGKVLRRLLKEQVDKAPPSAA